MVAVALDLQEDEGDPQFLICLLSYQSKTYMIRVILSIDFVIITIFLEKQAPCPLAPINRIRPIIIQN
jgi:hypothetical protein